MLAFLFLDYLLVMLILLSIVILSFVMTNFLVIIGITSMSMLEHILVGKPAVVVILTIP